MSHQPPHSGVPKSPLQLREYAYYRTGGTAAHIYQPETIEQLAQSVREAKSHGLPLLLLGGGTNSLVVDEPFVGAAILFRRLQKLQVQGQRLIVGAGVDNSSVALSALKAGLSGAAWMYRLPGQMGGTVRMNARCYGGEISQIVRRVVVVTASGTIKDYTDRGMFRGYKDTVFMETGDLIAEVELELSSGDRASIERAMIACETDRASKGQFLWPSCGCVFKNDYRIGVPSGMLLEASGVKSFTQGGAAVSQYHANFVYNTGATSRDIFELTHKMREAVFQNFGVWLEYEMEVLGSIPSDLESRLKEKREANPDNTKLALLKAKFAANQTKP